MLIQTPAKLNDIITLKLIGGDEVVGKLTDERTDSYFEITKPLLVMMAQQGFGMIPYVLTAGPDARVQIDKSHVITSAKTLDAVAKQYVKQTTGLIT